MSESIFLSDGERFTPTEHARGPWDQQALHGGAPAALMTAAFERLQPGAELRIARLGFEFLRPIPFAPLALSTRIVRPGRRVQELAGELTAPSRDAAPDRRGAASDRRGAASDRRGAASDHGSAEEELVCRATALRVQEVPADTPLSTPSPPRGPVALGQAALPPPETGEPVRFSLDRSTGASFASSAMEMRGLGDPRALGPGRVWMRLRHPLLPGETLTALARLAATADFGNGVSAVLPFDRYLFINADLTIHLHRPPRGEWIGLDARTLLHRRGTGLAESVLHDVEGPVGRAFQTLVVQPRRAAI
jgi:acyl-coenzyme A thioesterase PaaI-like protein